MNLSFNFLKDKSNLLFALFLSLFAGLAMAGTGGAEWLPMYDLFAEWLSGGLGKVLMLGGMSIGAGVFVFGGKVMDIAKPLGGGIFIVSILVGVVDGAVSGLI